MNNIWKQDYNTILVSVKFLGIWWEFWSYPYVIGTGHQEHFQDVKNKCIEKFGDRPIKFRLHYPDEILDIN